LRIVRLVGRPHIKIDPFVNEVGAPVGADDAIDQSSSLEN
jgi:hypothetical protein